MRRESRRYGILSNSTLRNYGYGRAKLRCAIGETMLTLNKRRRWEHPSLVVRRVRNPLRENYTFQRLPRGLRVDDVRGWALAGREAAFRRYEARSYRKDQNKGRIAPVKPYIHPLTVELPHSPRAYPNYREKHVRPTSPCACCFQQAGRTYMLKGTGPKALSKTKGMQRFQYRARQDHRVA
jgi:hypothetical protein